MYTKESFAAVLAKYESEKGDEATYFKMISVACGENGNTFSQCKELVNFDSLSDTAKTAVINGYLNGAKYFYTHIAEELDYARFDLDNFSAKNVEQLEEFSQKNNELEAFVNNYWHCTEL